MNTKAYLRDWKAGDTVTAADLHDLTATVAMLEAAAAGGGGSASAQGGTRRLSDGPVEMPWQVYAAVAKNALELRVIPGQVILGLGDTNVAELQTATLSKGSETVQDFEPQEACIVWLELTGTVSVSRVNTSGVAADTYTGRYQRVTLSSPSLRVTCSPADNALRVWALAAYDPTHQQKVTQLAWGDLSAMECRGMIDESGEVVWPQDRSSAADWTTESHRSGMATMCAVDATHDKETITGTLSGCIDLDGAVEFFMGPTQEDTIDPDDPDPDNPDPDDPWTDDPSDDDPDDDTPDDDPYDPVHPDPDDPDVDPSDIEPTYVRYGYVAGKGFKSCTLVNNAEGTNLCWKLVIDTDYIVSLLANIKAEGEVSFSAGGSSPGVWATVSMGLGSCTASTSGLSGTGSAGLTFQGTTGDASKKSATAKITYTASPKWTWNKTYILLPVDTLHDAGTYVIREKGTYTGNPFVEAGQWYRFRINASAFKKHAQNYFKTQLAAVSISDSDTSTSSDSTVSGTLSGTLLNPSLSLTLS